MSHDDLLAELLQAHHNARDARDEHQDASSAPADVQLSARGQAAELQGLDQLQGNQVDPASAQAAAALGLAGDARDLPHLDLIQAAFGSHDVGSLDAHLDALASDATESVNADALIQNEAIAFGHAPDVREAAREAARAVWQREGDPTLEAEQANEIAEVIADRVAEGRDAEALLDRLVSNPEAAGWRGDSLAVGDLEGWSSLGAMGLESDETQQAEHEASAGWAEQHLGPQSAALSPAHALLSEPPLWARKRKRIGDTWLFDPESGAHPDAAEADVAEQEFQ